MSEHNFPIDPWLEDISNSISHNRVTIIKADPGVGKTTRVPPYILKSFDRVLVLEPRRMATKLTSEWIASQMNEKIGQTVGYQMRFDKKSSDRTRLQFITEGIFPRLLLDDPNLDRWDVVILDEFHERNINSDIAYALVDHLMSKNDKLRLVIMSATIDVGAFGAKIPDAKVFDIKGQNYPVTHIYQPIDNRTKLEYGILEAIQTALSHEAYTKGNVLVFLPGQSQISATKKLLDESRHIFPSVSEIIPLSSSLAQNFTKIRPKGEKIQIILSTNVAETSLTLPDITTVIDTGLARLSGISDKTGFPTLNISKISQASAIQRAGRAGRVSSGIAVHLYSQMDLNARNKFTPPEVFRSDLSQLILSIAGIFPSSSGIWRDLNWPDAPSLEAWEEAEFVLKKLKALNEDLKLSSRGAEIAKLPLPPRIAAFVIHGKDQAMGEVCLLLALVILEWNSVQSFAMAHTPSKSDPAHAAESLLELVRINKPLAERKFTNILKAYSQIAKQLKLKNLEAIKSINESKTNRLLFTCFADCVAKQRDKAAKTGLKYLLCKGREAVLSNDSTLKNEPYILALSVMDSIGHAGRKSTFAQINLACAVDIEQLSEDPFRQIEKLQLHEKNKDMEQILIQETRYGKILLERHEVNVAGLNKNSLLDEFKAKWESLIPDADDLKHYHWCIEQLNLNNIQNNLPEFKGDLWELLLDEYFESIPDLRHINGHRIMDIVNAQISYDDQRFLKTQFPTSLNLPSGKLVKIDYKETPPAIKGKLQWFFGLNTHPTICSGKIKLKVILLAPNQRPAQITSNLPEFWQGSYKQVRTELKQRYPKHDWPENP